jgi:hypothetical protein
VPQILGIHGIAQQFTGGPKLTNQWWMAMRGGLEAAGYREAADALPEVHMRVVFYGDLFRPSGTKAGGGPPYTADHIKPGLNLLLQSPALAGVAERAFIGDLKQVTAFLADPDVKERVLQRTADEVTPDTKVIIGHSLGSVVAYEFLARFAPPQVELLITVCSPLGMPRVVFDRLTPPPVNGAGAWPGTVSRWVNIADKNDVVALVKALAPLFPPPDGTPAVQDHLVANGKDPHGIEPPLTSQAAGQALAGVL